MNELKFIASFFIVLALQPATQFYKTPTQENPTLTVDAGFASYTKSDSWTPLRVTLVNKGELFDGTLEVLNTTSTIDEIFTQPVVLAAASSRTITLYVPGDGRSFEVHLLREDRTVVARAEPTLHKLAATDRLILTVSDPPDALNLLGSLHTPYGDSVVAQLRSDEIPEYAAALNAADVLVFRAVDTSILSKPQIDAIHAWVLTGGHLLLIGGPSANLAYSAFADLAPAAPGASMFISAHTLSEFGIAQQLAPSPTFRTDLMPVQSLRQLRTDAEVLAAAPETPLIVRRHFGSGFVDQLAFDPALAPLRDHLETERILAALLGARVNRTNAFVRITNADIAQRAAATVPATALPSPLTVLAWLAAYLFFLGPVNFFFLRRIRRLHLAWITLPVLTTFTCITAIFNSTYTNGNQPLLQRLTIRFGQVDTADAQTFTLAGAGAARVSQFDVFTDAALTREIAAPRTDEEAQHDHIVIMPGATGRIAALQLGERMRTLFAASNVAPHDGAAVAVDAYFQPADAQANAAARITAIVHNHGTTPLHDCTLLAGRSYHSIGTLTPSQSITAVVQLQVGHPQTRLNLRGSDLARNIPYNGRYLSSAGETSPPESSESPAEPAPFELNGAPLTDAVVNWQQYEPNTQHKIARQLLIEALLGTEFTPAGLSIACWSNTSAPQITIDDAQTNDETLLLWRTPLQPYLIDATQDVPPDLYEWDLTNSDSAARIDRYGLTLEPGTHIVNLDPWLPLRRTRNTKASMHLDLRLIPESRTDITVTATVDAWDWQRSHFQEVAPTLDSLALLPTLGDEFVAPNGDIRLRLHVRNGQVTLTHIAPTVHFARTQ
ncbi:MAG: hypothetical protein NTZ50_14540 [Chloroflexi bacterium]|nr:hypothetical protein [Chloroflexota bacterium]